MRKYSFKEEFSQAYHDEGFVILRDVFRLDDLAKARNGVLALFGAMFPELQERRDQLTFLQEAFGLDRDRWRTVAKRMHDVPSVVSLAGDDAILKILADLGLKCPLMSTHPEVRTDMPSDSQFVQPWHQDWRYGQGSWNSATIWMPLHDVTREMGSIWVLPESHLLGSLPCTELSAPRRFEIAIDQTLEATQRVVELEFGEVVVFSQMLVHRSGVNVSDRVRLSCQLRYADAQEERFRKNGYAVPGDSVLVWSQLPSSEAMKRIHVN